MEKKKLTLEDIFKSNKFHHKTLNSINWLPNNEEFFIFYKGKKKKKIDIENKKQELNDK